MEDQRELSGSYLAPGSETDRETEGDIIMQAVNTRGQESQPEGDFPMIEGK